MFVDIALRQLAGGVQMQSLSSQVCTRRAPYTVAFCRHVRHTGQAL